MEEEMRIKAIKVFCLILFCFLAFISYLLRPTLFGFDSYAHLNLIKYGFVGPLLNAPVANLVFGLFPDSLLFVKFFMLLSAILCIVAIFSIVAKFYGERLAWISTFILIGFSPVVLFTFGEFENELLAYPCILWSIYFLLNSKWLYSLICACYGLLFWKWVYYLTWMQQFGSRVIETNLFSGVLNLWFLLPFVVGIVFLKKKNKWLAVLGLFSVGLWLWNGKFVVFLLPFLALSIANAWDLLKRHENVRKYLLILAFFGIIGWNVTYFISSPNDSDWLVVSTAINASKDRNIALNPDLGWDYWITYKTGNTDFKFQHLYKETDFNTPTIWVTSSDSNCELILNKDEGVRLKRIYYCK